MFRFCKCYERNLHYPVVQLNNGGILKSESFCNYCYVLRCGVTLSGGEAFVLQAVPPSAGVFFIMSPSTGALPRSLHCLGPLATYEVLRETMKGAFCIVDSS